MKNAVFSLFFLFPCLLLLRPAVAEAPKEVSDAIVLLESDISCATGFFLANGQLITNTHVSDVICPANDCSDARVIRRRQGQDDELLDVGALSVKRRFRIFDMAVLEVEKPPTVGLTLAEEEAPDDAKLNMVGYPGCEPLKESRGTFLRRSPLFFMSTALGRAGNSGSPLLDEQHRVVGLISAFGADLFATLAYFADVEDELGGLTLEVLKLSQMESREESFQKSVELLDTYYYSYLKHQPFEERWFESMNFTSSVEGLMYTATIESPSSSATRILNAWGHRAYSAVYDLGDVEWSPLSESAERLALAYTNEYWGIMDPMTFEDAALGTLSEVVLNSSRSESHRAQMIAFFNEILIAEEPGMILMLGIWMLFAALLFSVWAWTLGFVYGYARGGFIIRFLKMAFVGVFFWPLSFVLWWLFSWRKEVQP